MYKLSSSELKDVQLKVVNNKRGSIFDQDKFKQFKNLSVGDGIVIPKEELTYNEMRVLKNGSGVHHFFKKRLGQKISRRTTVNGDIVVIRIA